MQNIGFLRNFTYLEFDNNFSSKVLHREIQTYLQPLSVCLFSGSSSELAACAVEKFLESKQTNLQFVKDIKKIEILATNMGKTHSKIGLPIDLGFGYRLPNNKDQNGVF